MQHLLSLHPVHTLRLAACGLDTLKLVSCGLHSHLTPLSPARPIHVFTVVVYDVASLRSKFVDLTGASYRSVAVKFI